MQLETEKRIILASQSPARLALLNTIGIKDITVIPADIDETELPQEKPEEVSLRLAEAKGFKILQEAPLNSLIISADSVTSIRNEILPKALTDEDVRYCMNKLSGIEHNIHTGLAIYDSNSKEKLSCIATAIVKFKKFSNNDIEWYISTKEGINKAGGFSILGAASSLCEYINGQVSTIVGLPLYETKNMLESFGYKFKAGK